MASFCASETAETGRIANGCEQGDHVSRRKGAIERAACCPDRGKLSACQEVPRRKRFYVLFASTKRTKSSRRAAALSTPGERFKPVPRERQKASVSWLLRQLREGSWLDDRDLVDRFGLGIPASWRVRTSVLNALFGRGACVTLSSHLADDPYTMSEFAEDVYREVWASALEGRESTPIDRLMQRTWLNKSKMPVANVGGNRFSLQSASEAYAVTPDESWAYGLEGGVLTEEIMEQVWDMERTGASEVSEQDAGQVSFGHGYGWQGEVNSKVLNNEDIYFYKMVRECRDMLQKKVLTAPEVDRPHYRAMLLMAEKLLMERIV